MGSAAGRLGRVAEFGYSAAMDSAPIWLFAAGAVALNAIWTMARSRHSVSEKGVRAAAEKSRARLRRRRKAEELGRRAAQYVKKRWPIDRRAK